MIQLMMQHTVMVAGVRTNRLVVVAGGNVYGGDINGVALVQGGSALIDPNIRPQAAAGQGNIYLVDGSADVQQIDVTAMALTLFTASAGTAPVNCTIAVVWRDRLILAAPSDDPQNFFASRSGDHTDFDYGQTDPAAAFAGNASTAGRIGDVITALIPFHDDVLLIGGDHSIAKMDGDLADGGSINILSDAIGVLGPNAWCQDPAGNVYLVSTSGFFRIQIDGGMQNVSGDRVAEYFKLIDRTTNFVECQWDRDRHGAWIFVTPHTSTAARHLFYDARLDAFFPQSFPVRFGPITALVYDGDAGDDRLPLLGGRDGYIQVLDDLRLTDDGDAISSEVFIGPLRPSGDAFNAKLMTIDFTLGERVAGDVTTPWNLNWIVQAGSEAHEALIAPDRTTSGTITTTGAQDRVGSPLAGQSFWLKLWNDTSGAYWSIDRINARFAFAGRRRM